MREGVRVREGPCQHHTCKVREGVREGVRVRVRVRERVRARVGGEGEG